MRFVTLIIFCFMCMVARAAWASPGKARVRLRAFKSNHLSWVIEANLERCRISVKKGGTRRASLKSLAQKDCADLADFIKQAGKPEVAQPPPEDGERYEFELRGKRFPVAFAAPQRCEIGNEGELGCEAQRLSPLQRALLILENEK